MLKVQVQDLRGTLSLAFSSIKLITSTRYTNGARVLNTHIYEPQAYPLDLIGPVTVMWKALPPASPPDPKAKDKGRGKANEASPLPNPVEATRIIWIRAHPSIMQEVYITLQASASLVLDSVREAGLPEVRVELAPLQGQVNMFEIMGPKSSQVIKGALSPVMKDQSEDFKKVYGRVLTSIMTSLKKAHLISSSGRP